MAQFRVSKNRVIKQIEVEEDAYILTLNRDEAIAILSLTGKCGTGNGDNRAVSPRGDEVTLAAGQLWQALFDSGMFTLADSYKVTDRYGSHVSLYITGQSII